MTKRDAQAAEYAEEQVQVAAARQMESQIVGTWQARQRARAKSSDAVDRLVEVSGWSLMSTPAREAVLEAAAEIERLRFAIRRIAEQDATLSVCEGDVTVTVDATLTDAEREAVADAADRYAEIAPESAETAATLRGLLERLGGGE